MPILKAPTTPGNQPDRAGGDARQHAVRRLQARATLRRAPSTLSSYVAVLGGVLEVRARFGTLAIRIGFPEEPSARAIPPTSDRRRGITRDG